MEFRLPKCAVLIMKRGKVVKSEGISMPDGKMMKNIEEGGYKYLGILEANGVKHEEMKDQIKKEYFRILQKYTKVKIKWKGYYFNHQFKSSFHCKICSRNHKLEKDET